MLNGRIFFVIMLCPNRIFSNFDVILVRYMYSMSNISSIVISLLLYYLTKNFCINVLLIGCITSISCQIGDLFFSFLKRKSLLKDTGNFLPGHGGILDRVDGILFGMPIGFATLLIMY